MVQVMRKDVVRVVHVAFVLVMDISGVVHSLRGALALLQQDNLTQQQINHRHCSLSCVFLLSQSDFLHFLKHLKNLCRFWGLPSQSGVRLSRCAAGRTERHEESCQKSSLKSAAGRTVSQPPTKQAEKQTDRQTQFSTPTKSLAYFESSTSFELVAEE